MLVSQAQLKQQILEKFPEIHEAFTKAKITDMDTWVDGAMVRLFLDNDVKCQLADNIRSHLINLRTHGTWGWQ